jgi:heme/copper-type cytochrome/quinol oxidase subunit 2
VNTANLVDYLTKREYLYRQLSSALGGSVYVPKGLTASPNNPLIHLFKTSYNLTDPINTTSESLRSQFQDQLGANPKGSDYLLKSQYKPLRKGISNMLRLHATGTVAMPIEMRLQILASSRDIIHSWAVPGAGIKIDCVPGYTSHRTAIFLVSGIY